MNRLNRRLPVAAGAGLLLVVVAAGVFVASRSGVGLARYAPGMIPESVARNYQMALLNRDVERAYGYLSPTLAGYPPSVEDFDDDLRAYSDLPPDDPQICMFVESARPVGGEVEVTIREQWYTSCLFPVDNLSFHFISMRMRQEPGGWKVVQATHHFAACWTQAQGCP